MSIRPLAAAIFVALAGSARAEDAKPYDIPVFDELDRIVVSATLNERAQKDVASEVGVVDAAEIDRRQVQDIADLIRYEPGVSATGTATGGGRFGTTGISIRGLGGNRVRIELDGIAIPDSFEIGSFSSAGRDVVDVDALKRVEIVRGAASSLYGSDALGGVVGFVTKDPLDFVGKDGGQFASAKFLYGSADRESSETGTYAAANAHDGIVLVATHRDGSATANQGEVDSADSTRTRPNPQDTHSDALLAKYVRTADSGRIDRLTLDADRGHVDTDVLSGVGFSAMTNTATTALTGKDTRERFRLAFEQDLPLATALADDLDWKIYAQRTEIGQDTFEDRFSVGPEGLFNPKQRYRRFTFSQAVFGGEAIAHKSATTAGIEHDFTYGLDLSRTRTEEKRDGYQRDVTTGAITHAVLPDVFPVRDFPITDTTNAAVFAQDEMRFFGGRLSLMPALRVDYYKLDPKPDRTFVDDNPGVSTASLSNTSWSPKLGAIWRFDDTFSAYAQYAHGFRAPPYNDVNIGFTNLQFGYTAIANPHLKAETSNGLELGLRTDGRLGYASVSVYENRYHDFIESQAVVAVDPETGFITFQSINLGKVKIRGAEARFGVQLGAFADALAGWSFKGSLETARGDDETAHAPLVSIDPQRAVLGFAYAAERWGAELTGSLVARKDRLPAPSEQNAAVPFAAPGYATLDFYSHWQALPRLELFGALTNLTDRHYWSWGRVAGLPQSAAIDRYSMPGRAIRVGLRYTF